MFGILALLVIGGPTWGEIMFELFALGFAFGLGLAVRLVGLPPLVGFLLAGFGLNLVDQQFQVLPDYTLDVLGHVAHWGVLLLLFTVGLKLKLGQLTQSHVVSTGLVHFILSTLLFVMGLRFFITPDWIDALLLGMALSFSSTVLAAKILESKRELTAFHGRTAIGILIIQDLLALLVLSVWGDQALSPWAACLLLLPLSRPVVHRLLDYAAHDELLILIGMVLALVVGGLGFSTLGLSSELGALAMGMLLASHDRSQDISEALWGLKELFLIGFFLQIGMSGLPTTSDWLLALGLLLVLPLKGVLFYALLAVAHLRARNAFLAALSLTAYSEFGLIVAAGVPMLNNYMVSLALAVALSFVISAPLNRSAHPLAERLEPLLVRLETQRRHPDEVPPDLSGAKVLIFGMGRTGTAAFDALKTQSTLLGIDSDPYRVEEHASLGRQVVLADAEDANFWASVQLTALEAVILAMDDIEAKLIATRKLRDLGFEGPIVTHVMHQDRAEEVKEAGADETYLTMAEAGTSLARHAVECLARDHGSKQAPASK